MTALRPGLPPLPDRIKKLPVDERGYPVPWFVEWINGKPEFRIADGRKKVQAVNEHLCWVCGQRLGTYLCFVIGPMCAVNRITSEPPTHRECAEWSAQACPFLSRPHSKRREAAMPEEAKDAGSAGIMIKRNPGVTLLWITKGYRIKRVDNGFLFELGQPRESVAIAEGRTATAEELRDSIMSGLPLLREIAEQDTTPGAVAHLNGSIREAGKLLGLDLPFEPVRKSDVQSVYGSRGKLALAAMAAISLADGVRR